VNDPEPTPNEEPTVNQVSVYLLQSDVVTFAAALRPGAGKPMPVSVGDLTGEVYLARRQSAVPNWLPFLRSLTGGTIPHERSRRLSAVLFLQRGDRRLAVTFGAGRHMLRPEAIEPDYGLKVAAGLIDPEDIASLDARSVEATSIQIRRQSSRGVTPGGIGFNVSREMLRALAGRVSDETLGSRIVGSDAVGLTARLDPHELGARLDRLHNAYAHSDYQARFQHIDRWSSVPPGGTRARLDETLMTVLSHRRERLLAGDDPGAAPGPERPPNLEAPEVIEWRASGFVSSVEQTGAVHPFPSLDGYLAAARRPPTISDLKTNHRLQLISDESADIVAQWPVYGALNWELELDENVYILAEGRWWKIDDDYRQRIDAIVAAVPAADLERPDFDPVEDEIDYNRRLASYRPNRIFLDRKMTHFTHENGTVEACDVLTSQGQFIHVKPDAASSMLSHLFAQGLVSARLFLMLPEFRKQIRGLLADHADLRKLVPTGRPDPRDYEVVYAIVRTGVGPLAAGLPFFARNLFAQVIADLELLGYRVSVARIGTRIDARPTDAGPLHKEEVAARKAEVMFRSTPRARRRAAAAPAGTAVVVPSPAD